MALLRWVESCVYLLSWLLVKQPAPQMLPVSWRQMSLSRTPCRRLGMVPPRLWQWKHWRTEEDALRERDGPLNGPEVKRRSRHSVLGTTEPTRSTSRQNNNSKINDAARRVP